jgi:hypothetical protein
LTVKLVKALRDGLTTSIRARVASRTSPARTSPERFRLLGRQSNPRRSWLEDWCEFEVLWRLELHNPHRQVGGPANLQDDTGAIRLV